MYWVETPPEVRRAYEAANERFNALVKERDAIPEDEHGSWSSHGERMEAFQRYGLDAMPPNASERYRAAQTAVSQAYADMYDAEQNYFRIGAFSMSKWVNAMYLLNMVYPSDDAELGEFPDADRRVREVAYSLRDGFTREQWYRFVESLPELTDADLERLSGVEEGQARWWRPNLGDAYLGDSGDGEWVAATVDEVRAGIDYMRRVDEHLRNHPPNGGTAWATDVIPSHKFSTNDGWHVTPDELNAALREYNRHSMDRVTGVLVECGLIDAVTRADEPDQNLEYWHKWIAFLSGAARHGGFKVH